MRAAGIIRATLVIARTANEPVARDLAKVLETDNLIHLSDPLALVDATVIIGKDYEELSKRWQRVRHVVEAQALAGKSRRRSCSPRRRRTA